MTLIEQIQIKINAFLFVISDDEIKTTKNIEIGELEIESAAIFSKKRIQKYQDQVFSDSLQFEFIVKFRKKTIVNLNVPMDQFDQAGGVWLHPISTVAGFKEYFYFFYPYYLPIIMTNKINKYCLIKILKNR